jgi:hypothetical protein
MKMFKEDKTNKKMAQEEMKNEFYALYNLMANSQKVENMHTFGMVHKEMFEWFVANKPELAQEWLDKLESIKWHNYLSPKEADKIVADMNPSAPWSRDQWRAAMKEHGFEMDKEPYYNRCALFVTMNMKMSDSGETLAKYIAGDKMFEAVYNLAVDSLTDKDGRFKIREYFGL